MNLDLTNKPKLDIKKIVDLVPVFLIVLLMIIFSCLSSVFLRWRNIIEILQLSSVYLLIAAGITFPILMGSIDLSITGIIVASGVIAATIAPSGGFVTVILIILIGLCLGIFNGVLIAKVKLPSFIVTLATNFIYCGIAVALTDGYNINIRSNSFSAISNGRIIPGIPNSIIFVIIIYAIFIFLSEKTKTGRYIMAIGGKEDVAARMGIDVAKYKIIAFALSGLLIACGTLFLSAKLGMASAQLDDGYMFSALIAVVVGGTALSGGVGGVRRTVLGVLIITILENGMTLGGIDVRIQYIVKAIILIAAVYIISIPDRSRQDLMK
jgi:ribose transport system permease protein/putative xylitol transport system permease protein